MICPNKSIPFKESILGKTLPILECLKNGNCNVGELYAATKGLFAEINEFMLVIDILYILDIIELDNEKKEVIYVKANNM